jgi:hypothetical protein
VNRTTGRTLATNVRVARGPVAQFRGWMGHNIAPDAVLGLPGCAAVHTFFVRTALDVVFCDANGRVLRVIACLEPFRFSPRVRGGGGAAMCWEARAGTLAPFVRVGDVLEVEAGGC